MGLVENLKFAMQRGRKAGGTRCSHLDMIRVDTALTAGVCPLCPIGGHLGAPALVHDLRGGRVLRFVQEPARQQARRAVRAPDRRVPGTGRGLVVVLRRSGHRGTPDHRGMTVRPATPAHRFWSCSRRDPAALERVGNELRQRYGRDYEIVTAPLPSGPEVLAGLAAAGRDVVFVLAGAPDHADAVTVLAGVRKVFPTAKRCLTLNWGDRSAAAAILARFRRR